MNIKTHRPCLMLCIVFALGIVVGKWLMMPLWWLFLGGSAFLLLYVFKEMQVIIYVLVFVLGMVWITQRHLLPNDSLGFLSYRNAIHCEAIEGVVRSVDDLLVNVYQIKVGEDWRKVSGSVKLRVWGETQLDVRYGQRVRIKGKMFPIYDMRSGSFSYRQYLQERGIYWMFSPQKDGVESLGFHQGNAMIASANNLRAYINQIFDVYLAPREAAFVSALVIGDRHKMPKDLKEVFVNTGTAHILAISGMNMAVVVTVIFFIFQLMPFTRRWKFIMTAIFLFAYAYTSGWSPSVVRATIMSAVLLSTFAWEYEGDALNTLGFAALILLCLDPNNLFDVGFQLSFAAVLGILVLTKSIEGVITFLPKLIALPIAVSIAAFIATAPIILYHFHMITPISILANIPVVPLADMVMALGLCLIAVSFSPPLATLVAACLKAILSAMIIFALWFSHVPWGCWIF